MLIYKGESTVIPSNEGQFTIYNGFDCNVRINSSLLENGTISPLDSAVFKYSLNSDENIVKITFNFDISCNPYTNTNKLDADVTFSKGKVRNLQINIY